MSGAFGFASLTRAAEVRLARALDLDPLTLPPDLAAADGRWKGAPIRIETRAYQGPALRYARFATVVGDGLEIGNLLCLPAGDRPLPVLGADLVDVGRAEGMLAVDLSPMLPPGPARAAQLAGLAARRAVQPPLPSGGDLPDWCRVWFSEQALYTRVPPALLPPATVAFETFIASFVELVVASTPEPARAGETLARQAGYAAVHREDDKGLRLLATMFGADWASRYLERVLFPDPSQAAG